jgi:DNA-binding CsgD family transcriptional regulator
MKKILLRVLTLFIYILALFGLVEFKFWILFNIKMILMVVFGTILLTLSNYKKGMTLEELKTPASWNATITAYLMTFILLFSRLSNNSGTNLLYDVAMNCRPLLYGLVIHILLKSNSLKINKTDSSNNKVELSNKIDTVSQKLKEIGLTDREIEISLSVCNGLSNKEIGDILFISESTVKKHTSNFYKKIKVSNREQLKQFIKELTLL